MFPRKIDVINGKIEEDRRVRKYRLNEYLRVSVSWKKTDFVNKRELNVRTYLSPKENM